MKKFISILLLCFIISLCPFLISANTPVQGNTSREERIQKLEKEKQDFLNSENFTGTSDSNSLKNDTEIKEKYNQFCKKETIDNENDSEACQILVNHYNLSLSITTSDKQEYYRILKLMVNAIKSNEFTNDEKKIFANCLERRYSWIDDNNELKNEIKQALNINY